MMKLNIKIMVLGFVGFITTQSVFAADGDPLARARALLEEPERAAMPVQQVMDAGLLARLGARCSTGYSKGVTVAKACIDCKRTHPIFCCGMATVCCACCGYCGTGYAAASTISAPAAQCCGTCGSIAYVSSTVTAFCCIRALTDAISGCCRKEESDGEKILNVLRRALAKDKKP